MTTVVCETSMGASPLFLLFSPVWPESGSNELHDKIAFDTKHLWL